MDVSRYAGWAKAAGLGLGMVLAMGSAPALAAVTTLSNTTFTGFNTGVSVDGQGGWIIGFGSPVVTVDEEVTVTGGTNNVFRLSNAVGSGSLGDHAYAPRNAGIPNYPSDTSTNPVLGQPALFAGESSTGAQHRRFYASVDFRSATGAAQSGLAVSLSPDNGAGGRMSYVSIVDTGSGIDLVTYDIDGSGGFVGPQTIATGLSYTGWYTLAFEILFSDGPANDVVRIYLDDTLIHTGTTWEDYYSANDPTSYPLGVPVQTVVFNAGSGAVPANNGGGYFFDNVDIQVGEPSAIPTLSLYAQLLLALGLAGFTARHWRKRRH